MIKKLRKKFILINMSIVMLLLFFVLFAVCLFSHQRYRLESRNILIRTLRTAGSEDIPENTPLSQEGRPRLPENEIDAENEMRPSNNVFLLKETEEGSCELIFSAGSEPDETTVEMAYQGARASTNPVGTLTALSLRYQREEGSDGTYIAFADISHELDSMKNLVIISILVFFGSMLLLYAISYFLAKWALTPVERSWQQQQQFVADASHELKTPLTVILANLKILLAHPEDTIASQKRWISNTQSEAAYMKKLVEDLLFLARSDADSGIIDQNTVNLSDLVWNSLLLFEPVAFEAGVQIQENIVSDITIQADAGQIKQLLCILLDNACKYTELHKEILVSLQSENEKALLKISNTGSEISPEDLPHLFERFYRADKARTRESGGYGLGLSIASVIVHRHHGRISVTSQQGVTTFSVLLPLDGKA